MRITEGPEILRKGIAVGRSEPLVPVRICDLNVAGFVERRDVLSRQRPADGGKILSELFFVACADDDGCDRGLAREPVQRDLRNGLPGVRGDGVERVDDAVQQVVRY